MADIKVKDIAKKSIKAIDKSAIATERFKDTIVHTKQKAENTLGIFCSFILLAHHFLRWHYPNQVKGSKLITSSQPAHKLPYYHLILYSY